jgi:hypothetical protein
MLDPDRAPQHTPSTPTPRQPLQLTESSLPPAVISVTALAPPPSCGAPVNMPTAISVVNFGADVTGAQDSTAAFTSALQAAGATSTVYVPAGDYKLTSTLTLSNAHVALKGDVGGHAVLHFYVPNADAIVLAGGGDALISLHLVSEVAQSAGSSGIHILQSATTTIATTVTGFSNGITVNGIFDARIFDTSITNVTGTAIEIGKGDPKAIINDVHLWSVQVSGAADGIIIYNTGGMMMDHVIVRNAANHGFLTFPSADQTTWAILASQCEMTGSGADNWSISSNGGPVSSISLLDCWGTSSATANGLTVNGPQINGVTVMGGAFQNNAQSGLVLNGAANVLVNGVTAWGNATQNSGVSGINIAAQSSGFQVLNSSLGEANHGGQQAFGVAVGWGSHDYVLRGNVASGNSQGGFSFNVSNGDSMFVVDANTDMGAGPTGRTLPNEPQLAPPLPLGGTCPVFNVADEHAANDTEAIRSALQKAAGTGGTVFLPSGGTWSS